MNMEKTSVFTSEKFGNVRVSGNSANPLFCLSDVCRALGISNASDCRSRLQQKGVVTADTLTCGGTQRMTFISEANLYRCIFQSRKRTAEEFQDWVTETVLPTIRKTGGFVNGTDTFVDFYFGDIDANTRKFLVETLNDKRRLMVENERQKEQIERMAPKEEFFDAVSDSRDAVPMNDVSKVLGIPGFGRNNLFEFLRRNGVLMYNNQPYQKFVDANYFRVIEQRFQRNGEACIYFKTLVYQKGIDYIRRLLSPHCNGNYRQY